MIGLLFLLLLGYLVYWLSSRPKTTGEKKVQDIESYIEFPRFFFALLAALLLAFNIFVYGADPGIGVAIFQALAMVLLFIALPAQKRTPLSIFVTTLGVLSSLAIGWRANGFVQSFNAVVYSCSFILLLIMLVVDKLQWSGGRIVHYFFKGVVSTFSHVVKLFQRSKQPQGSQLNFTTVLRTTIITVVLLGFFVGLLSQADPIFAKLVKEVWEEALGRAVASVFVAVLFTVWVTMRFKTHKEDEEKLRFFSFQDVLIPGVAVACVFGIFIFVQAKYLFGSQVDLQSFGLTYSEYVRKGFTELLTATFFGGLFTYLIALLARQEEVKAKMLQLQALSAVLIVELSFLLGSAWRRNEMYMDVYGLTRVRMIGEVFLYWLAGFLGLLLLFAIWKKWSQAKLFIGVLLLSSVVFVALNVRNVDQTIVEYSPSHHNFRDYFYLTALSEDGRAGWQKTIEAAQELIPEFAQKTTFSAVEKAQLANMKLALISLRERREKLEEKYMSYDQLRAKYPVNEWGAQKYPEEIPSWIKSKRKWQAMNTSQYEGYLQVSSNPSLYTDTVNRLITEIVEMQKVKGLDLYEQEQRLLFQLEYPFVTVNLQYYPQSLESMRNADQAPKWSPSPVVEVSPTPPPDLPY
jgi:hypothetical protein